jgi:Domain of unknown function (DUF4411)
VGLWEKLDGLITEGRLLAVREVLVELERKDDGLCRWVTGREKAMVVEHELDVHEALTGGTRQARPPRRPTARTELRRCLGRRSRQGTRLQRPMEELRKGKPDQPRIPFVCDDFGIPIVRIVDLIRREGWVFRS